MIGLAVAMIRSRAASAATMVLLATVAIGAAVAAPVYLRAAQRSVAAADVAAAGAGETTIVATAGVRVRADPGDPDSEAEVVNHQQRAFDRTATDALAIQGFATVFAVDYAIALAGDTAGLAAAPPDYRLEFRQGYCGQIDILSGRCTAGPGEVMVGSSLAAARRLGPGSTVHVQAMTFVPPTPLSEGFWKPDGRVAVLSVVGVYRLAEGSEAYWSGVSFTTGARAEPVLADRGTLSAVDHPLETQTVVSYPLPGRLSDEGFASVRADVDQVLRRAGEAGTTPITSIEKLLATIDADQRQAARMPALAAVPLVLLCCVVVFLAAANTAQGRRLEIGMLKLRGSVRRDRLWLGSAEILVPLAVGALAGYVAGHVGVWLFTRATLSGPAEFTLTTHALPPAAVALAAATTAGLLGLRRDLTRPVAELLRRVPARTRARGGMIGQTVAIALAVAAVVQVRTAADLSGVSVLAPALVILAIGMLAATAFDPFAAWWGGRALRRGRLGLALGLLNLGRRRNGSRLLALLVVAIGLVGFAAIAADTANRAREEQVSTRLGADRVASVRPTSMRFLLRAVRGIDPEGAFAMAVMPLPAQRANDPPVLAVDSPRLGRVANWRTGASQLSPAGATSALRPEVAGPVELDGSGLVLRAALASGVDIRNVSVSVVLAPLDGSPVMIREFPLLRRGEHTYRVNAECPIGCRLVLLAVQPEFERTGVPPEDPFTVTLASLAQTGPDRLLVGAAQFGSWAERGPGGVTLTPGPEGLAATVEPRAAIQGVVIGPADVPVPLPGVAAGQDTPAFSVPSPNARMITIAAAASTAVLPRLGGVGGLVDMEYLARRDEPGMTQSAEVWLGPAAPADVVDRLRGAGLGVTGVRHRAGEMAAAEDRPNSVGVRFLLLVAALCLLLGAGGLAIAASVELGARAEELRALRTQGVRRATVGRAGRLSYLIIVLSASVLGALAAMAAWLITRDRLPLVDVLVEGVDPPRWPGVATLWAWAAATGALTVVGVALAAVLSRRAGRGPTFSTAPAPPEGSPG